VRLLILIFSTFLSDPGLLWQAQSTGVDANLRGVSISQTRDGNYVVWASGSKGTVLRSLDDGKSWKQLKVDGGDDFDFRDIETFGADTAYLMSSGDSEKSRIYKTTDGGASWSLQYTDKRSGFFLDSLACASSTNCFALSDPVDGKFLVLSTNDGQHWKELPRDKMPAAFPTEGAFAASGTSIALCGDKLFFGTGGPAARVFHSADQGGSWTVTETLMASGNASSGIFSMACRGRSVVAVGGDYRTPDGSTKVAIYSKDSGTTWRLAEGQPGGYRSGAAFFSDDGVAAVGTNGTDISHDGGVHWIHVDSGNLNAAYFLGDAGCSVGPKGAISCLVRHRH
jgi:photosystem II stability/assembly factor-like uncharacterized protein